MAALAPAEMAINNSVTDGTGLLPAHVTYGIPLSMPVNVLVGVGQSPATGAIIAN